MKIEVIQGDITKIKVDAVVNAANSGLRGGGGVDGAIHRAGGPQIMEECRKIGGCPTGEAVITTAGNLPARYVIHAVGPIWTGGANQESDLLHKAYWNSLQLAAQYDLKTVAFPNISTGIYGYPKRDAAEIAFRAAGQFRESRSSIELVMFVCFDQANVEICEEILATSNF